MEEDARPDTTESTGEDFSYKGRWRGRKLWILLCAAVLAAVAVLFLIWALPSADNGGDEAVGAGESDAGVEQVQPGTTEPGEETDAQTQPPSAEPGGQEPTVTPGTEATEPDMVVNFPDPADGADEQPPPGGYTDVYGNWVLDMNGSQYGLTNCHIVLEENGTISSPPDYDQVFEIVTSQFRWESGNPAFSATLQLILKLGSNQGSVALTIELSGTVEPSFEVMGGDFIATPQGEAYAPYAQRGTFSMHR